MNDPIESLPRIDTSVATRQPRRKKPSNLVAAWLVLGFVVICGIVIAIGMSESTPSAKTKFVPDPTLQANRKAFIQELIANGIIQKIDGGLVPDVWVTPTFILLDYDAKVDFCNAIYAFYFPDPSDMSSGHHIELRHSKTGERIGSYSPYLGLSLD